MKNLIRICLFTMLLFVTGDLAAQNIHLSTPRTSLVLSAPAGGELKYVYYGSKLTENDCREVYNAPTMQHGAYPVYGMNCPGESALAVTHADGNMTLQMEVAGTEIKNTDGAVTAVIKLKDKVYPFSVNVCYKAYSDVDIIETWTEIAHAEKKNVTLRKFDSAFLPVRRGDVWLSSLYGSWANEGRLVQEPLEPGMKVIKNRDGVRNSHTAHAEVMFSLDGKPQENYGNVIGAALCYGGNYKLRIDTDDSEYHQFYAGINEENSVYNLKKGELFITPALALTYSAEGLSGCSRNFHRWARKYKLAHGNSLRKILLNSWEGVYFKVREAEMKKMMNDISSLGGELFVMDDGWFKGRNTDTTSLGDWTEDKKKFPGGLQSLAEKVKQKGIDFGIWFEPEMISRESDLYREHPDWVIRSPLYEPILSRHQLVLDLSNPAVCEYLIDAVSKVLVPGNISYVKWDMNRHLTDLGSAYLDRKNQNELSHRYVLGLYQVMETLTERFPQVLFESCSSGGGRFDAGMLYYMPQTWTSDNTDAVCRLKIQHGTSFLFPTVTMGAHVSACPNHQVGRTTPLATRFAVAAAGNLGYELDLKKLSKEEKEEVREQIAEYKRRRRTVQFGTYYRLADSFQENQSAWNIVSEDGMEVIFTHVQILARSAYRVPVIRLKGLDPDAVYTDCETGQEYGGDELMYAGIRIPRIRQDFSSTTMVLRKS